MPAKMYDWRKWFSQPRCTIRRGIDYDTPQDSMAQQIRNAASTRGMKVSLISLPKTEELDDGFIIITDQQNRMINYPRRIGEQQGCLLT